MNRISNIALVLLSVWGGGICVLFSVVILLRILKMLGMSEPSGWAFSSISIGMMCLTLISYISLGLGVILAQVCAAKYRSKISVGLALLSIVCVFAAADFFTRMFIHAKY